GASHSGPASRWGELGPWREATQRDKWGFIPPSWKEKPRLGESGAKSRVGGPAPTGGCRRRSARTGLRRTLARDVSVTAAIGPIVGNRGSRQDGPGPSAPAAGAEHA